MKTWLFGGAMVAALAIAGAVPGDDATAQIIAEADRPMPGEYSAKVTFQSIDLPGAPPQMADMMSQMMSRTMTYCLTEAEIEEGYRAIMDRSAGAEQDCSYERYNYSAGTIDAVMQCEVDGRAMTMAMSGTGGATSSDITMKMSGDFGIGDGTMTMRVQHARIGECS